GLACCCAFDSLQNHAAPVSSSCCSEETQEHKEESCNCSIDHQKGSHEIDINVPAPVAVELPLQAAQLIPDFLPNLPESIVFLKKWPPERVPGPSVRSRLTTGCSYLI